MQLIARGALSLTLVLGGGSLVACGDDEPTEYVEICVDQYDNRVSEDYCRNGFNSDAAVTFLWMYFLMSYALPPYGGHVNRVHGTAIRPQHATFYRAPATGGYGYKPPPAKQPPKPVNVNPPKQPAQPKAPPPPVIRRK